MGCGASTKKAVYSAEHNEEQKKQTVGSGQAASSTSRARATSTSSSGETLSPGTRVRIEGLTGAVELNGKVAVVCSLTESTGRYVVEIENGGGQKSLKKDNLNMASAPTVVSASITKKSGQPESDTSAQAQPPKRRNDPPSKTRQDTPAKKEVERQTSVKASTKSAPSVAPANGELTLGDRVRVGGLNGAIELNGKLAVVFGVDKPTGRYILEFENGAGQKKLKGDNLTAMGTATGPLAAKARMFAEMNGE